MPVLELINQEDERLATICTEVEKNEDILQLINDLRTTMIMNRGVGLAAPQVGVTKRIIVIKYAATDMVIINPCIIKTSKQTTTSRDEGCLSFPDFRANKIRHKRIVISGYSENWQPIKLDARGFLSFVVQHEIDHLNGITIQK